MSKSNGELDASIRLEFSKYKASLAQANEKVFSTKSINFLGRNVTILLQNENGPCPLLAIANCLLLQNRISFSDQHSVSLPNLISTIADAILSRSSTKLDERQHVQLDSVLNCLPKYASGLDINVGFTHVKDVEFTSELCVFDSLDIDLYHGWVVDPQDTDTSSVLSGMRINKVYDELIRLTTNQEISDLSKGVEECAKLPNLDDGSHALEFVPKPKDLCHDTKPQLAIIKSFLASSSSQMTFFGLTSLHSEIKERQLAVLYRNAHFSLVFKFNGILFSLVTDEGYRTEASVVWEKNVEH